MSAEDFRAFLRARGDKKDLLFLLLVDEQDLTREKIRSTLDIDDDYAAQLMRWLAKNDLAFLYREIESRTFHLIHKHKP